MASKALGAGPFIWGPQTARVISTDGTAGQVLKTDGARNLSFATISSLITGTPNTLAAFNGSGALASMPVVNTAGRAGITPTTGLIIFNTDTSQLEVWNGTSWQSTSSCGGFAPNNTRCGEDALLNITTGAQDTAVGYNAGIALDTGNNNTLLGYLAGQGVTSGYNNVFVGDNTGASFGTGNSVTIVGSGAGSAVTDGTTSTFIGAGADADSTSYTNATAIGAGAIVGASDSLILGNGAKVGIGTSTPAYLLDVMGTSHFLDTARFDNQNNGTTFLINWYMGGIGSTLMSSDGYIYLGDETTDQTVRFVSSGGTVTTQLSGTLSYFGANGGAAVGIGTATPRQPLEVVGTSILPAINDVNDTLAIDTDARTIIDSSGNISIDWENHQLNDAAALVSIDWDARSIIDPAGTPVASWASGGFNISAAGGSGGNVPNTCNIVAGSAGTTSVSCAGGEIATGGGVDCGNAARFVSVNVPTGGSPATGWQGSCSTTLGAVSNAAILVSVNCCAY